MTDRKILAVVGATGAQGGGLVDAILDDPGGAFTARALTRNTDSDKARQLRAFEQWLTANKERIPLE